MTTSRAPARSRERPRLEETIEPVELAVHPDAERLKRPRRRIDPRVAAPRNRAPHDRRELRRARDRRLAARLDERAGDAPREPLLAVLEDHVGELGFGRPRDEIGGGLALRAVHPHVERFVALETEAAARRVELHRRDAEVGERAVDHRDPPLVEHVVDARGSRRARARRDRATARASRAARASASRSRSRPMSRVAPASSSARA